MMRSFNKYLIVLTAVLAVAVACSGDDPEPAATPEPTSTPVPTVDLSALDIDTSKLDAFGLTEADIQCLAREVETEIIEQVFGNDLSAADALSVIPALQACGVDLVRLIEAGDYLLAESAGDDYEGLDSLPFTAEQIACLVLVIDAELLEDLVGGEASQTAIVPALEAFIACGIGLADLLALAGDFELKPDLGDASVDDIPPPLPGGLDAPDISDIVDTSELDDLDADLPFSAEQLECLTAEIDIETITALAAGEVSPLVALSFIGVLSACGVNLTDLVN